MTVEFPVDLDALSSARRLAVAELLREMLTTERALAALYARFAARSALDPLRAALSELAREKATHVAALEPLARALETVAPSSVARGGEVGGDLVVEARGAEFAWAFRGERALEVGYRELASLLGDPTLLPSLPRLAAGGARHRTRLRQLYLRYS